jgi:PAS domain S-box-containing protein
MSNKVGYDFSQAILSHLPFFVSYVDRELRYQFVNRTYEQWFDVSQGQILGRTVREVVGAEQYARVQAKLESALNGIPQEFQQDLEFEQSPSKVLEIRYIPDMDSEKRVQGIIIIVKDITKQKAKDKRYQTLLETMSDGFVSQDVNGVIRQYNPAALEILGLTEDQLLGRTSFDPEWHSTKEDGSNFEGKDHPAMVSLRTGERVQGALMGLTLPTGEKKWIRISATPHQSSIYFGEESGGNERGVITTFSDVTDMQSAKMEQERFFSVSPDMIGILGIDGVYKRINPSFSRVLGFSDEEIIGRSFIEFVEENDRSRTLAEFEKVSKGTPLLEFENRLKCKSGEYRTFSWAAQVDQRTNLVYAIGRDVTEQRQKEDESRYLLEALKIGVWKFNPVTQNLHWDRSMYELYDRDPKDFSGHFEAWESTLTPEAKERAVRELEQALEGSKEFDTSFEIQTRSRGKLWIAGKGKVVRDPGGNPIMMYGLNFDCTSEVALEKQLEQEKLKAIQNSKLASLGEMSAGIAHEINNPLTIVTGALSHLVRHKDDPEKFNSKVQMIEGSIGRIAKIVKGLKKFARMSDQAQKKVELLSNVVGEALVVTEAKAKHVGAEVRTDFKSDRRILCNDVEIEQVVINLVNNAIDANKKRDVNWVELRIFDRKDQIILQVIDSGCGISKEVEEKLFQPFFTTKDVGEGTGLGLSISKGILDQHKATIAVGLEGGHTCFEVAFPAVEVATSRVA